MRAYLASLERLAALSPARIYSGHGPVIERPAELITQYLEHRRMRERQVLDALHAGVRTVREMVARIYADVPRGLHPLAEESVWNHLLKLEGERRVRRIWEAGREIYELLP